MRLTEEQKAGNPLRVMRGGKPVEDQVQGVRDFKAAALRSEDQAPYDAGPAEAVRYPPIVVLVRSPSHGARQRFADLIAHILVDSKLDVPGAITGGIEVVGYMDDDAELFLNQLDEKDARIRELVHQNHDQADELALVREQLADCESRRHKAVLEAELEASVSRALESRLGDYAARKLALQVAHGDVPPDQYEARRKIEVNGVRDFVSAVRAQLQLPRKAEARG